MGRYRVKKQNTPETTPADYVDIYVDETSGRLSTIDDDGNVVEYTNIDDEAKVKADSTDPTAGFLEDKVDGTSITVNTTTHKLEAMIMSNYPVQEIHVSIDGDDTSGTGVPNNPYSTIEYAISTIVDSSVSKPYVIKIHPGTYSENNPLTIPSYTNLIGETESAVTITSQNQTANTIEVSGLTVIRHIAFVGPTGAICLKATGDLTLAVANCVISGSQTGIESNQSSTGGTFIEDTLLVGCNTAIKQIGKGQTSLAINTLISNDSDLVVTDSDATVLIGNTTIDRNKISLPDQYTKIYGSFNDVTVGDEALVLYSELSIGRPELGKEACFGEGDSYTRGMLAFTYNSSLNSYTNVTSDLEGLGDGNTVEYPALTADNAIYISSTLKDKEGVLIRHLGHKLTILDPAVGGSLILEYYNGSTWEEFSNMGTTSGGTYLTYAKNFMYTANSYQVRFDSRVGTNWVANDPIGIGASYYWVRYRIVTTLTTSPTIDQVKLHSNRSELNEDGYLEFFGKARPVDRLPWDAGLLEAAAASPSNQDLYLSDTLDVGRIENLFANGATDRIGFMSPLPLTIDTSSNIKFSWAITTDGNSLGDIDWVVQWGYFSEGDNLYDSAGDAPTTAPNQQSVTLTESSPVADTVKWYTVELDISDMVARRDNGFGDTIVVTLQRNGGADTHSDDVALSVLSAEYVKWCSGGHIG